VSGVLVTGMGVVSPAGVGLAAFHAGQLAGHGATGVISHYDPGDDEVRIAGQVDLPDELALSRRDRLRTDRCTQLAAAAVRLALQDAVVDGVDPARVGVVIGSSMGGQSTVEENYLSYFRGGPTAFKTRAIPMSMINDPAAWTSIRYGFTGPCLAVATACASGADAIVAGYQMITCGEADVVLAGGAEAPVVRGIVSGFAKLGALSRRNAEPERASRPFSKDRDGFVIAEGAAVLVLESAAHAAARGARAHAELRGYGRSSDAHHVTMPHPSGAGAAAAITAALRGAGAEPGDVGLVNAHGTGTALNDVTEALAIRAARLGDVPVTATKSLVGHALGAAGAIEAVATVQAVTSGLVPPTANLDEVDPEIDLDVVCGASRALKGLALSNSFAFGGHNVVLAFAPVGG
jgi:3-oxoacyl-[acyl-carrier-protein] synthase II